MTSREYPKYLFTSYSRMESFKKCPSFYQKRYIERQKVSYSFNPATTVGTWSHSVLEEILDPETSTTDPSDAYALLLPGWLKALGAEDLAPKILEPAMELGQLLYKASARYAREDAIRTAKGECPKDVWQYPTATWTKALRDSGLKEIKYSFDNMAANYNVNFVQHSLIGLLAEAYNYVMDFECPTWAKTLAVEFPISSNSQNRVPFPGQENLAINLYIDWIVANQNNHSQILILDFKTDDKRPSEVDVLHNPQLNLYSYSYEHVCGIRPYGHGIFHLPTGQLITARTDMSVQKAVIDNLVNLQTQIDLSTKSKNFYRRHPQEYMTPCKKQNWQTGAITEVCPFLDQCWPVYSGVIALETEALAS